MKPKTYRRIFALHAEHVEAIQQYADEHCRGNQSEAIRRMIERADTRPPTPDAAGPQADKESKTHD